MRSCADLAPVRAFPLSPADPRSALSGRATDARFAQNPIPVLEAMGEALARHHLLPVPRALRPATAEDVAGALAVIDSGGPQPRPYETVDPDTIRRALRHPPDVAVEPVVTHGAPVVAVVTLQGGRASFDDTGTTGLDPAERDLAIALRSIAETFAPEATVAFLDAYEGAGGSAPDAARLDWYALVAAFR